MLETFGDNVAILETFGDNVAILETLGDSVAVRLFLLHFTYVLDSILNTCLDMNPLSEEQSGCKISNNTISHMFSSNRILDLLSSEKNNGSKVIIQWYIDGKCLNPRQNMFSVAKACVKTNDTS